jgi:threonine aldolase
LRTGGLDVPEPETNIVMATLTDPALDPRAILDTLARHGVWMGMSGARRIRAITHLDIDDEGIRHATIAFHAALPATAGAPRR